MVVKFEEISENKVKLYIESTPEQVKEKIAEAYRRNRKKYNVKGFRPGKAPQKIIEQYYGKEVFFSDAFDLFVNEEYFKAIDEKKLVPYGDPKIADVVIEEDKMAFSAEVSIMPMPEFGEFKGIEVPELSDEVTDEELEAEIKQEIKRNSRLVEVTDRPAQNDDVLTVDFVGTVDGVEFEGGKAEGASVTLGEGRFIPGFEEQLVGATAGSEVTVNVTFPEDYFGEDLAGKDAVFNVKVHDVKAWEEPEFNDDFVSDISEFETVDEYKQSIREKLMEAKRLENRKIQEDHAVRTLVETSTINLPEEMIENNIERDFNRFAENIQMYGMQIDDYARMIGKTVNEMKEEMAEESRRRLFENYALVKLAEKEELMPSPEQLDELIKLNAMEFRMTEENFRKEIQKNPGILDYLVEEGMRDSAIKLIMDNVVYVDPDKFQVEEEVEEENKEEKEE